MLALHVWSPCQRPSSLTPTETHTDTHTQAAPKLSYALASLVTRAVKTSIQWPPVKWDWLLYSVTVALITFTKFLWMLICEMANRIKDLCAWSRVLTNTVTNTVTAWHKSCCFHNKMNKYLNNNNNNLRNNEEYRMNKVITSNNYTPPKLFNKQEVYVIYFNIYLFLLILLFCLKEW